jgi:2-hydroxychromene-2-carboxylate isomerase
MSADVEFWFEFGSNYSYLSVMRIGDEARQRGLSVAWRPFLLGPIFKAFGWDNSPFVLQKEKGAYVWRDMARLCAKYDLGWTVPSAFPRNGVLAARIALAGEGADWQEAFCREVMLRNFVEDRDISTPESMTEILTGLGLDAAPILAAAQAEPVKARLRALTEEAQTRKIFGAPTFFVGDEMFWGNDRMEDALDWAVAHSPLRKKTT